MARITDLPNELLIAIFEFVRGDVPKSLPAILFACRSFVHSANMVLHEHLQLSWKLNPTCSLVRFIQKDPNPDFVRSLRLHVQKAPLNAFTLGMKVAHLHVEPLCNMLLIMRKLTTFSLNLEGQIDRRCTLPGSVIVKILNALPESVRNLELDTEGTDGIWENAGMSYWIHDAHVCLAVSRLLPQLENLSLRVSAICPEVLSDLQSMREQRISKLKSVIINLELGENRRPGPSTVCDCRNPRRARARMTYPELAPDDIFSPLLELQKNGTFPYLQRFYLFTARDAEDRGCRKIRDVATRSIISYPIHYANAISSLPRETQINPFEAKSWYMTRDQNGDDWYGGMEEMRAAIGHDAKWDEIYGGCRLPQSSTKLKDEERKMHRLNTSYLRSFVWMQEQVEAANMNAQDVESEDGTVVRATSVEVDRLDSGQRAGVWYFD